MISTLGWLGEILIKGPWDVRLSDVRLLVAVLRKGFLHVEVNPDDKALRGTSPASLRSILYKAVHIGMLHKISGLIA